MGTKQIAHRHLPSLGDLSPSHVRYLGVGLLSSAASLAGVWLFLPATIARFGLIIIWIVTTSIVLRTIISLELARYTCLTGQAAPVGFAKLFSKPKHFTAIFLALGALQAATLAWAIPPVAFWQLLNSAGSQGQAMSSSSKIGSTSSSYYA